MRLLAEKRGASFLVVDRQAGQADGQKEVMAHWVVPLAEEKSVRGVGSARNRAEDAPADPA